MALTGFRFAQSLWSDSHKISTQAFHQEKHIYGHSCMLSIQPTIKNKKIPAGFKYLNICSQKRHFIEQFYKLI